MKASTAREVWQCLRDLPSDAIVFMDVDDTLITPVSKTFRSPPLNKLIDDIKKNKDQYPRYAEILSNWRVQRRVMLLDKEWPRVLDDIKSKFTVYGLTKMDVGALGCISSMEEWRYQELKSLNLVFSQNEGKIKQDERFSKLDPPVFYKGIFMTGSHSKSDTLLAFLSSLPTTIMVMVDDRKDHLEDIRTFCEAHNISFLGILFTGLENFRETQDLEVFEYQKKQLIENARWLEDAEAEAQLSVSRALDSKESAQ